MSCLHVTTYGSLAQRPLVPMSHMCRIKTDARFTLITLVGRTDPGHAASVTSVGWAWAKLSSMPWHGEVPRLIATRIENSAAASQLASNQKQLCTSTQRERPTLRGHWAPVQLSARPRGRSKDGGLRASFAPRDRSPPFDRPPLVFLNARTATHPALQLSQLVFLCGTPQPRGYFAPSYPAKTPIHFRSFSLSYAFTWIHRVRPA